MADFKKLIDNKAESAQYMIDGITDVIKKCGKRGPGSEGREKVLRVSWRTFSKTSAAVKERMWSPSRNTPIPSSAG